MRLENNPMKLADFIEENLDSLVDDWAEFASGLGLDRTPLTSKQLRNSARMMLEQIAADMRTLQSDAMQKAKSRGEGNAMQSDVTDAAHVHADDRHAQGFNINDVVAEFRALRATVLRRWTQNQPIRNEDVQDIIRFNEAVDQTLTESVRQYSMQVEAIRDRFAGVLAHDLRTPLGAITNAADLLLRKQAAAEMQLRAAAAVQRSAVRMRKLVDDLLDFARTRLGDTLPIDLELMEIGRLCTYAIEEVSTTYPDAAIHVSLVGDLAGRWDRGRISQLFVNLMVNAVQHGSGPIRVSLEGQGSDVRLSISNGGEPIAPDALRTLFDPLTRSPSSAKQGMAAGVGLGLYICKCIVVAHGGSIGVTSNSDETTFTVILPRAPRGPTLKMGR
jgi:signal transduction histidine kinase